MRLGFHYHVPAINKDGGIYMPGVLGCFVDSLAEFCDQVTCFLHSPRLDEICLMDYRILSSKVHLVDIGTHASAIKRTITANLYTSYLKRYACDMDILLVRGPSPLLPAMVTASPVPTTLLLVGDYVTGVDSLPQPYWRKEAIRQWSYWNKWGQNHAARHSLTFVNSRVLYAELRNKAPDLYELRTTTLTKDDFFIRPDTCQSRPYRLLYTGRMDRSKGLLQMVEAVSLLSERGEEVMLDLVGWPERGDPIIGEIQALAYEKNITGKVHYLGSRPLGPELFACYQQADIFLMASFASEGFPRTIWEAMANCLPVIATRVGSIPAFIEDAAELIPPGDVESLAGAISKLIHHTEVRQRLIERGLELARGNTLENQASAMVAKMKFWLGTRNG